MDQDDLTNVSDPRRLAFCITDLDAGGAERALVQIVTRLAGPDWTPKVFCLSGPGELVAHLQQAGIPVECLGAKSPRSFGAIQRLTAGLRDWRPELLQTFLFHANLSGRFAAWRANIPVVVCGLRVAERDAPWRMRLDRWSQRLVTHNVAVSHGVVVFAQDTCGLSAEKISVIPNGVDDNAFATAAPADLSRFGVPAGARVLTFIGRLHPQKGPDFLIDALASRLGSESDLHLLMVGDGPMRPALERRVEQLGRTLQTHFAGRQSDVAGLLKASTAMILPSRWEGMANVVLEAMAAGCPVIASDVEGTRELIANGETGWLFPVNSHEGLQTAVDACLCNPARRETIAHNAQRHAKKEFTWPVVTSQYADLYRQLLDR